MKRCNSLLILFVQTGLIAVPAVAAAQDAQTQRLIDQSIVLLKQGCQIGIKEDKGQAGLELNLEATLRRLLGAGVQIGAGSSRREAEGLVSAFEKEVSKEGAALSQKQLECTQKFAEKILDFLYSGRSQGTARAPDARATPEPPPPIMTTTVKTLTFSGLSQFSPNMQPILLNIALNYQTNAATGLATGPCEVLIMQHGLSTPVGTLACNINIDSQTFIASGNVLAIDLAGNAYGQQFAAMQGTVSKFAMNGTLTYGAGLPWAFALNRVGG